MSAPRWFVEEFRAVVPAPEQEPDEDTQHDEADALWERLQSVGWEGHRLLGGERLPSGRLSKAQKVPTLILPATEEIPGGHVD